VVATVPNVPTPMGVAFTPPDVKEAYVVNGGSNSVSVIDTTTTPPTLAATVQGQGLSSPIGVAMASTTSGDFAYVSNSGSNTVSVIAVGNNPTVVQNVIVGTGPRWVAVTPDSSQVYVENAGSQNISVISVGDNNQVIATIPINGSPNGAAFTPDSKFAYVADSDADTVSVIYTASNPPLVVATLTGFTQPTQVAMSTDGSLAYVTNANNTLSVVNTASNTIVATVPTGSAPAGVAIASNPQAPLTLTQPLSPTQSNNFNFGTNNYRTSYPPGTQFSGMYMTVTAVPITQAQFHQRVAGIQQFAGATCIVSAGAGGDCVDHVVTCSNDPSGNPIVDCPLPAGGTIDVETDFATGQSIVNPGYLTATVGQNNWQNIFSGIFQEGPRTKVSGKTAGFSEFVAVSLGVQSPQGQARFELLSPQFPKTFPAGLDVPIEIGLKSVVDGGPITGASVNISLVMTADANGNPTQNVVLLKNAIFKQSQPGVYQYSIKAAKYALGTYSLTIYGDMFPAYSGRFLVATPTTTGLSSSPNPSTHGQAVTFTAVVVPAPPDGEIVSFIKAGAVLGTGTLIGGSASLTISTLKAGTRTVKAVYGGDSRFAASRSKALDQKVNPN
jgi:YVTN family beta-propeller protein